MSLEESCRDDKSDNSNDGVEDGNIDMKVDCNKCQEVLKKAFCAIISPGAEEADY